MTRTAHSEGRPTPVFRECDGAPWPSDDELELEAEWAAFRESGDVEWWTGEEPAQSGEASSAAVPAATPGGATASGTSDSDDVWSIDDLLSPLDGGAAAVSDIDARLGHLECVVNDRQRATADEYRLILAILDDAAFDPTPWVGPDPTLDRAWNDPRGRTPGAVRRDRTDLAERAAVAEVAVRLRLSEQTVRTRAAHARTLAANCPQLWTAFSEGRLSEKHAVDAARLASTLPAGDDAAFKRFDDEACPQALVLPPGEIRGCCSRDPRARPCRITRCSSSPGGRGSRCVDEGRARRHGIPARPSPRGSRPRGDVAAGSRGPTPSRGTR